MPISKFKINTIHRLVKNKLNLSFFTSKQRTLIKYGSSNKKGLTQNRAKPLIINKIKP